MDISLIAYPLGKQAFIFRHVAYQCLALFGLPDRIGLVMRCLLTIIAVIERFAEPISCNTSGHQNTFRLGDAFLMPPLRLPLHSVCTWVMAVGLPTQDALDLERAYCPLTATAVFHNKFPAPRPVLATQRVALAIPALLLAEASFGIFVFFYDSFGTSNHHGNAPGTMHFPFSPLSPFLPLAETLPLA